MTPAIDRARPSAQLAVPVAWIAALVIVLARRPLAYGATWEELARFHLFLAAYVVGPGWAVLRLLASPREDWLSRLAMAWSLGHALQALAFVGARIAGVDGWFAWYPLLFAPLLWLDRGSRTRTESSSAPGTAPAAPLRAVHLALLLAVIALAIQRETLQPMGVMRWLPNIDFRYHAGNAVEFDRHWPLTDPRFAGEPLRYHFFSYAFPAAASRIVGVPIHDVMGCLGAGVTIALLALLVFDMGRRYAKSPAAGLAAATLVVFHADFLEHFGHLFGAGMLNVGSYLDLGIYESITTLHGLVCFASLAIVLHRWLARETAARSAIPSMLAFGAMASGAKASVMPVVVGGLAALAAHELLLHRRVDRRVLVAAGVLLVASLPMTLFLLGGQGSFAPALFHWAPGIAIVQTGLASQVATVFGMDATHPPAWLAAVLVVPWLAMFLGLAGVGALLAARARRSVLSPSERWLWMCVAAALVPALLLGSPALAQLFFLYNAEIGLAVLAAPAIVGGWRPCGARELTRALMLAFFALPLAVGTWRDVAHQFARDAAARAPESPEMSSYREALAWLRESAPEDAVIVRKGQGSIVSVYGERRAFCETSMFTHRAREEEWRGIVASATAARTMPAFELERHSLVVRFFAEPSAEAAERLSAAVGPDVPTYVLVDSLQGWMNAEGEPVFSAALVSSDPWPGVPRFLRLEFANATARIYRLQLSEGS